MGFSIELSRKTALPFMLNLNLEGYKLELLLQTLSNLEGRASQKIPTTYWTVHR